MQHVLIVEDDSALADGLCLNLEIAGFGVRTAGNIRTAYSMLEQKVDLLLLDINLPDGSGVEFAKEVRKEKEIPIIFLTAKDLDEDMIAGFLVGADDYITKPFNIQVLVQRIKAVLRRYQPVDGNAQSLKVGNLQIDFQQYTVEKGGNLLSLTPTEFKLLVKFCQNPGIVLTRQILMDEFWDQSGNYVDEHTLTIFISRLRGKIADEKYSYIKTVYGTGYRWIGAENE